MGKERRFAALVAHFSDAIVLLAADGTALYASPAIERILGFTPASIVGSSVFPLIHPDDLPQVTRLFGELLDVPGSTRTAEFRVRCRDGSWRWLDGNGTNLLHEPDVQAIVANFHDITARRYAEDELRSSRDQLEAIFRSASEGITVQDETGHLVFANAQAARMLGVQSIEGLLGAAPAELLSRFEIFDEAGAPFPEELLPGRRVLAGEEVPELTLRFRLRSSGEDRWVVVKATPVTGALGHGRLVVSVFHDITERKRTELLQAFLAEASRLFAASLDYEQTLETLSRLAVPAFADVCLVDLLRDDASVERVSVSVADPAWSEAGRGLKAHPPGTNPNNPVEQVLAGHPGALCPDLTEAHLPALSRAPEHLAAMRAVGPRSLIVAPLRARGRVLGALTMIYGWSRRRYTEDDLAAMQDLARRAALAVDNAGLFRAAEDERRRLRQVLAVLPEGIVTLDTANYMAAENAAAADILGLFPDGTPEHVQPDETLGARRVDGTPIPQDELPPWRALRGETVRGEQLIVQHQLDGHELPLLVNSAPLRDGRGTIVGSVSAFQDISAIREFERARDEFLASASHDLRTPLTAIQGFTQLLLRRARRGKRDEALLDPLEGIERAAGRMAGLVRELLDVARLQMGQPLDLDRRPVDLVQIARQEAAIRNEMNRLHDVRVHSDQPAIVGRWDGARLERVLANLVGNAVKYSPAGGEVRIELARETDGAGREQAVVRVHDQGLGIAAADLPHVFDRFYRGRQGRRIEGMGLGLATVRQIVEQHGGSVDVTSTPGEGTTFTVRLPLETS